MDLGLDSFTITLALELLGLGVLVGAYGTMIGAGGGFLLVPVLLLLAPDLSPASATAMSLTVVFFNAYAGVWSYARMGRIDFAAGCLFAIAGLPGALLGTYAITYIPREPFALTFGVLLMALGLFLGVRPGGTTKAWSDPLAPSETAIRRRRWLRGALGSAYLGLLSSLLGIGGGILQVPFFTRALGYPAHIAIATSQFVLLWVTFTGVVAHLIHGELQDVLAPTAFLALGMMMGAPVGASLSSLFRASWLLRLLALAMCVVAGRMLWSVGQALLA